MVENKLNSTLVLFVGLPACGKSTLSRALATVDDTTRVVSIDKLYSQQEKGDTVDAWHAARHQALEQTTQVAEESGVVVVDDTFEYQSMRKPYLRLAQQKRLKYIELGIPCSTESAIANNATRPLEEQVAYQSILNIASRIEYPEQSFEFCVTEFHNDKNYAQDCITRLSELIKSASVPEAPETPSDYEIKNAKKARESELHLLDQTLRKQMASLLQNHQELQKEAKQLSLMKKQTYEAAIIQRLSAEQAVSMFKERLRGLTDKFELS